MTEGRHHRRRDDDDLTADGIYVPPPREMPRPRSEPPAAAPSPWAPVTPGGPPAAPPERTDRGRPAPARSDAQSSSFTARSSPWAPVNDDEYSADHPPEYNEEEPYAPAEDVPPPPPAHTAATAPRREDWLPPLYPQEWPPGPTHQPPPQQQRTPAPPPMPPPMAAPRDEERPPGANGTKVWVAVGVVIVALAVAAGVGVGLNLASRSDPEPPAAGAGAAEGTCGGHEVLRATVTPELAPVLEQAAADIGANQPGGCRLIAVTATDTYAGGEAWVPATAGWAQLAKFEYAPDPVSLARTPVVIASPRAYAETLGWPDRQPTWASLGASLNNGQGPKLSMGSPLHDTAGMLAAMEIRSAMIRTTTDPGIAQTRALSVRARLADAEAVPAKLLERMAQQTDAGKALRDVGLFPVTEQEFWQYQQSRHPVALAALYPADVLLEADFPLLLTPKAAADDELKALTTRLAERMHAKEFAAKLTSRGLRPVGDAAPSGDGLSAKYQTAIGLPDNVAEWAATWAQYKRQEYHGAVAQIFLAARTPR